jgi:lipopolysaccharide transport system ATP-binding protein
VRADQLGKRFKLYARPWDRAVEWASAGRSSRHHDFWALRGVSFAIERGECFGVLGPNGAGKTTLLRLLSGILQPSEGSFQVAARAVYSLLELGTGLHPDLTGAENVRESARLLGLPPVGAQRLEQIRAFADIGEFFDRSVRFYSSGMLARLGFALFAYLEPELLIVDETLSVGDQRFQQKCVERIDALREGGTAFLFVSHDTQMVRRLCRRALVLHHGQPVFVGDAEEAVERYQHLLGYRDPVLPGARKPHRRAELDPASIRRGQVLPAGRQVRGGGLELVALRVSDSEGQDTLSAASGELLHIDALVRGSEAVAKPDVGVALYDRLGSLVFAAHASQRGRRLPALAAGQELGVRLALNLTLGPGLYTFALTLGSAEPRQPDDWRDLLGPLHVLAVSGLARFHGTIELPVEFRHGPVEVLPVTAVSGVLTR